MVGEFACVNFKKVSLFSEFACFKRQFRVTNIPALRAKGLHRVVLPHCSLLRLRDIREHVHDWRSNFLELAARMCNKEVIKMNEKMEAATERDVTLR